MQSHRSLLMSFDWLAFKVRCRVTDHCQCHLIGWHSNPGAESLIIVNVIRLASIQIQVQSHGSLLMLFDWLAFNQVQSHGSVLMSFDCLTIKSRCRVTHHCSCHLIGWHSKPGVESLIIVNVISLADIQSQVLSHGSLFMSFDWLAFKVRCRVRDHC